MLGRREEVAMMAINFVDNYRRDVNFYMKWLFSADLRKEMSLNKKLKNIHKGQRCFIIGNGPSLKHHDLTKLADEYVFTVNNMMTTDYFKTLRPNFHLFFDPKFFDYFFKLKPENTEEKNRMQAIRKSLELNPKMVFFSSYRLKPTFSKFFPSLKSYYIFNNKMYTPLLKKSSSLHRNTPAFQNVIIYAINIALYMGFDEIYLLGVDMTGFLVDFEYNKINQKAGHFYETSKEDQDKQIEFRNENNLDNEFYLKAYGKTFEHFKLIRNNVSSKKAKLFNASEHGALDIIERINYRKLFSNEAV